jgi:hypothetical protein
MTTKLAVTVAVDLDASSVRVRPSGRLTSDNVRGLLAVVRRAERILPGFAVQLDLDQLRCDSPEALRALTDSGVETLAPYPRGHPSLAPVRRRSEAGRMTEQIRPEHPERVFHRYAGWPLVPADDLRTLGHSLR